MQAGSLRFFRRKPRANFLKILQVATHCLKGQAPSMSSVELPSFLRAAHAETGPSLCWDIGDSPCWFCSTHEGCRSSRIPYYSHQQRRRLGSGFCSSERTWWGSQPSPPPDPFHPLLRSHCQYVAAEGQFGGCPGLIERSCPGPRPCPHPL